MPTTPTPIALDAGDNVTETFTVTASDGTTQTVTLSITGSDDVSVITGDTSGAATEAATDVTVTGALSISDVDADDSPSFTAATTAGTYGSFTVGTDGSWSYVLDADDADTDALDAGDNVYGDVHGHRERRHHPDGDAEHHRLRRRVGDYRRHVRCGDRSSDRRHGNGALSISDVEADDSPSFTAATTAGTYGSFTVGTDGSWSYVLDADDADTDALDAGDNVTETFTVTASDGTTQTVTLSIAGSDDVSVITGDTSGAATEAATDVTVTGALSISDVDADDSPSFAAATTAGTYGSFTVGTDGSLVLCPGCRRRGHRRTGRRRQRHRDVHGHGERRHHPDGDAEHHRFRRRVTGDTSGAATEAATDVTVTGALSISDVDADDSPSFAAATTAGTYGSFTVGTDGSWSYVLDADDADTDALDAGDNATETFTVTASDGTTQTVTLSIAGSDDVSVITGDTSGAATEAATDVTVTGALSISDVDADDSPSFAAATTAGTYGSFTVGTDGSWSYVLDADDADTDALDAGDNVTETFTVTASDGTTQTVTLSITGSDDVSVITGDTSGAATEAATDVTVTGALSISDVDADDSPSFAAATTAGTYGSFTVGTDGSWSYVLDADDADTDALDAGDNVTETFTVTASDGTTQTVT